MPSARFHASMDDFDAASWDALAGTANPFVSHAFLAGLERHGCIHEGWGWRAHHLGLYEHGRLLAAAPLYLKGNSHGEYVFDWSWAHAWERAGGAYYPKLLCAVPYSPVTGPRLLAGHDSNAPALQQALTAAMQEEVGRLGLSSVHANFLEQEQTGAFDGDWLPRFDWQFHWRNRGYADFDDFLAALTHRKRKNIRQERRQVAQAGVTCRMLAGNVLDSADWHAVHTLYLSTFEEKGNHATLTLAFFRHLADTLGERVQVALAYRAGTLVAMALFLRSDDTLYGRYWGAAEHVPALHFELCYYQGIDYCIRNGLQRFEPGAQGEHKLARGFLPVMTQSRHYLPNPSFRAAVQAALAHEAGALAAYRDELMAHSPFATGT